MGAGGSKIALNDPFPLDTKVNSDLDLLSMAVARILNTPDIYDLKNLVSPGTCGSYAVFLKKNLEKKLLPFVAEVADATDPTKKTSVEVVYQNPNKVFRDMNMRKQICSQMADSALRVVGMVVALLGSIQVASQSRQTAIAGVAAEYGTDTTTTPMGTLTRQSFMTIPLQRGGGIADVRQWLVANGYISAAEAAKSVGQPGTSVSLVNPTPESHAFKLTFIRTEENVTLGALTAEGGKPEPMPTGALRIQFINPTTIPGVTSTFLPMRILDNAGNPWMVGILYNNVFKSLVPGSQAKSPFQVWYSLFRKTQGWDAPLSESYDQLTRANEIFQQAKKTTNLAPLIQAVSDFFAQNVPGYNPAMVGLPPVGAAPGGFPGAYGVIPPQQPYGQPSYFPGAVAPPLPAYPGAAAPFQPFRPGGFPAPTPTAIAPVPRPPAEISREYDIPYAATTNIYAFLNKFRNLMVKQSCPAAVRAVTLAAKLNPDRTLQTGICRDPYWSEQRLSEIYPYLTLQFLCLGDWTKLTGASRAGEDLFDKDGSWKDFVGRLKTVYGADAGTKVPKLVKPESDAVFLDSMSFKGTAEIELCKSSNQNPRVGFQVVQEGLERLHDAYRRHIKASWTHLNALILVIEDPETKTNIVRLHPKVLAGPSLTYVNGLMKEVRKTIIDHYIEVETIYTDIVRRLTLVN
jgi:hypothetical protein